MRDFTFEDGMILSAILDKTNIKFDINALADAVKEKDKNQQAFLGGQMILELFKKIHLVQNEMFSLIANMTGDSVEVVKKYNITKMKDTFKEIFNQPGLKDFFA